MPTETVGMKTCWGRHALGDIIVHKGKIYRVAPARPEDVPKEHIPLTIGMNPPEGRKFITIPLSEIELR